MAKIFLITGGAGFIGSNFIRYFLNKYSEYKVINFDKLTYAGNLRNLDGLSDNPNYVFVRGDIANSKDVQNVFEQFRPDYVINFAAESHVDRSILDPNSFIRTNVMGTQILLNLARQYETIKFLQVSTDEVYGSLGAEGYFLENTPIQPNSPYSASKASADMLVRAAFQTHQLPVNITRCSNNYGPFQFPEKLIPLMIYNTLNDKELPVYGDGKNIRDWIHVDDHNRAIDKVLHHGEIGEVYNVGSDNEWSCIDLVKLVLKIMGHSEDLISFVKDRPGHDKRYAIDSSKIQKQLSWKPEVKFSEGLERTIEWYITNKDWTEEIVSGEYRNYYKRMYENR